MTGGARYGHSTRPPCERIPPIRTTSWRLSRFQSGGHKPPLSPATPPPPRGAGWAAERPAKRGDKSKGGLTHDRVGAQAGWGLSENHRGAYPAPPRRTGRRGRGRRGRGQEKNRVPASGDHGPERVVSPRRSRRAGGVPNRPWH